MRAIGPVHKKVAKGGEDHIGLARTLLGQVEKHIAQSNGLIKNFANRIKTPDGWDISVGVVGGQRYLHIIPLIKEGKEPIVANALYRLIPKYGYPQAIIYEDPDAADGVSIYFDDKIQGGASHSQAINPEDKIVISMERSYNTFFHDEGPFASDEMYYEVYAGGYILLDSSDLDGIILGAALLEKEVYVFVVNNWDTDEIVFYTHPYFAIDYTNTDFDTELINWEDCIEVHRFTIPPDYRGRTNSSSSICSFSQSGNAAYLTFMDVDWDTYSKQIKYTFDLHVLNTNPKTATVSMDTDSSTAKRGDHGTLTHPVTSTAWSSSYSINYGIFSYVEQMTHATNTWAKAEGVAHERKLATSLGTAIAHCWSFMNNHGSGHPTEKFTTTDYPSFTTAWTPSFYATQSWSKGDVYGSTASASIADWFTSIIVETGKWHVSPGTHATYNGLPEDTHWNSIMLADGSLTSMYENSFEDTSGHGNSKSGYYSAGNAVWFYPPGTGVVGGQAAFDEVTDCVAGTSRIGKSNFMQYSWEEKRGHKLPWAEYYEHSKITTDCGRSNMISEGVPPNPSYPINPTLKAYAPPSNATWIGVFEVATIDQASYGAKICTPHGGAAEQWQNAWMYIFSLRYPMSIGYRYEEPDRAHTLGWHGTDWLRFGAPDVLVPAVTAFMSIDYPGGQEDVPDLLAEHGTCNKPGVYYSNINTIYSGFSGTVDGSANEYSNLRLDGYIREGRARYCSHPLGYMLYGITDLDVIFNTVWSDLPVTTALQLFNTNTKKIVDIRTLYNEAAADAGLSAYLPKTNIQGFGWNDPELYMNSYGAIREVPKL